MSTGTSNTGGDAVQYEHTVKLLIERCASVLFDEAFGQELLTRLVVSMETVSSQNSIAEVISEEIIRDLRILLALSVYHKDILPADDMFQYVNSVLCCHRSNSVPDVSAKSTSTEDPCTPVELCLQVSIHYMPLLFPIVKQSEHDVNDVKKYIICIGSRFISPSVFLHNRYI